MNKKNKLLIPIIVLLAVALVYSGYKQNNMSKEINFYIDKCNRMQLERELEDNKAMIETDSEPSIEEAVTDTIPTIQPQRYDENRLANYLLLSEEVIEDLEIFKGFKIQLYAQVEKNEDGGYSWDDGQKWLLLASKGEVVFYLFEDYVQFGNIKVYLYKHYQDKNTSTITSVIKSASGMEIIDYMYDEVNNVFTEHSVLEKGNDQNTTVYRISDY